MKSSSPDGAFTDYTGKKYGVRVRAGMCRPLALEDGLWAEFDKDYNLPVPPLALEGSKDSVDSMSPLALCVWSYEAQPGELNENIAELRMLLIS